MAPGKMSTSLGRVRGLGAAKSGTEHFWRQRLTAVANVPLFIFSVTTHMRIGMQVIIEDYVHDESAKLTLIMANTFFCVAIALASAFAILTISFKV
jgi:succinate dehydrogenase / fumarate reductase membrane anchor subunit